MESNPIREKLKKMTSLAEKRQALAETEEATHLLSENPSLVQFLAELDDASAVALLSLTAIGQADTILGPAVLDATNSTEMHEFAYKLGAVELFYNPIGGIIGYHDLVCDALKHSNGKEVHLDHTAKLDIKHAKPPFCYDVRDKSLYLHSRKWGLEAMPQMAEVYVVGGAADRLGLSIPSALLPFEGSTLLELLIQDLASREHLYKKITGKSINLPIVMMTSHDKNNHAQIVAFCEEMHWFGRPKESFMFVTQPLVPMVSTEGKWCAESTLHMHMRPGGHGVLWKLMNDASIFEWLKRQGVQSVLVRQINNLVSDTDGSLLTLTGIGTHYKKSFGIAACDRKAGAAEGVLVLAKAQNEGENRFAISNVEYVDLPPHLSAQGPDWKEYPANTNIIFANIQAIQGALAQNPFPGLLINMKTKLRCSEGKHEVLAGRLESLMQNIGDVLLSDNLSDGVEPSPEELPSFITVNSRTKTISTVKKAHKSGESYLETPVGAFYDIQLNNAELLELCGMIIPKNTSPTELSFISIISPALGPCYDIAAQKVKEGVIHPESYLELAISELDLTNLDLKGSLTVVAKDIDNGKCILKNVIVRNKGIDKSKDNIPWQKKLNHEEALQICLQGNGEFYARDIVIEGSHTFIVPPGMRMNVTMENGSLKTTMQPLTSPTWWWEFEIDDLGTITLSKAAIV